MSRNRLQENSQSLYFNLVHLMLFLGCIFLWAALSPHFHSLYQNMLHQKIPKAKKSLYKSLEFPGSPRKKFALYRMQRHLRLNCLVTRLLIANNEPILRKSSVLQFELVCLDVFSCKWTMKKHHEICIVLSIMQITNAKDRWTGKNNDYATIC